METNFHVSRQADYKYQQECDKVVQRLDQHVGPLVAAIDAAHGLVVQPYHNEEETKAKQIPETDMRIKIERFQPNHYLMRNNVHDEKTSPCIPKVVDLAI